MAGTEHPAILCVGRLYCDLIFTGLPRMPSLGTEVFSDGIGVHCGGGSFITAAHLSALDHEVALAAMLPPPPMADLIQRDLVSAQVDLSLCQRLSQSDGPQLTVAMVHEGDRSFLTRRAGPAFPKITPDDLSKRNIRHLHVGEIASLAEQPEIAETARNIGITVSADCGWDDALSAHALRQLQGLVDVFLPNESEMGLLKDLGFDESFADLTVVKRGRKGATGCTHGVRVDVPTKPLEAVDTTGAGDAFNAGFLSKWLAGHALKDCLTAGNEQGALSVQNRGGFATGELAV